MGDLMLNANLLLARRAVEYLDGLGIVSVNVRHRLTSYHGSPLSAVDMFLFWATRAEYAGASDETHRRRADLLAVLRDRGLSKGRKRDEVRRRLREWGKDYFRDLGQYAPRTAAPDELRIRNARRAIKFHHGNCGEKSAVVATWLLENRPANEAVLWCSAGAGYDHAYVLFDTGARGLPGHFKFLSDEAVLVDGWTGDYYQAKSPANLLHGTHLPNPFQALVRKRVWDNASQAEVLEAADHQPPAFSPNFCLAVAEQPLDTYEGAAGPAVSVDQLYGVADDADTLVDALADTEPD